MWVWVRAGIDRGSGLDKMIFETATKNIRNLLALLGPINA
jgi:hypothetical protein